MTGWSRRSEDKDFCPDELDELFACAGRTTKDGVEIPSISRYSAALQEAAKVCGSPPRVRPWKPGEDDAMVALLTMNAPLAMVWAVDVPVLVCSHLL